MTIVYALNVLLMFNTYSPTDNQQYSKHKYILNKPTSLKIASIRLKIYIGNIRDNLYITTYYFQRRLNLFLDIVIKPKFIVTDQQIRYEFQARGSTYTYILLQLEDTNNLGVPIPLILATNTEEQRNALTKFQGKYITTKNPTDPSVRIYTPEGELVILSILPSQILNN